MTMSIACLGAANIDRKAQCLQPVVLGSSNPVRMTERPGGVARNVCENLARLGCDVGFFAPMGQDDEGETIARQLLELGVDLAPNDRTLNLPTATYTALTDTKGELVVGIADMEICDGVGTDYVATLADFLRDFKVWFFDTNLPKAVIQRLMTQAPSDVLVAVNTVSVAKAAKLDGVLDRIGLLFCNTDEATALAGPVIRAPLDVITTAHNLREEGVNTVVITRGSAGCYVASEQVGDFVPAMPTKLVDVTGAGDALAAGMLFGHSKGMEVEQSIHYGLAAAAMTCQTLHTVSPDMSATQLERLVEYD